MQAINGIVDTLLATAAIIANRVVAITGAHAVADNYGVALAAQPNIGGVVPVAITGTVILEAGAAIPLGTKYVIALADGRITPGGTVAACTAKVRPGQSAAAAGGLVECVWVGTT